MDTKEYGKMSKRTLIFEEGRGPDRNAKGWNMEGEEGRVTRKECKRLMEKFEGGGFDGHKTGLWNIAKERMLEGQGSLSQRGGRLNQRILGPARRTLSQQLVEGGCGRWSRNIEK